jgi:hypothetical protein
MFDQFFNCYFLSFISYLFTSVPLFLCLWFLSPTSFFCSIPFVLSLHSLSLFTLWGILNISLIFLVIYFPSYMLYSLGLLLSVIISVFCSKPFLLYCSLSFSYNFSVSHFRQVSISFGHLSICFAHFILVVSGLVSISVLHTFLVCSID